MQRPPLNKHSSHAHYSMPVPGSRDQSLGPTSADLSPYSYIPSQYPQPAPPTVVGPMGGLVAPLGVSGGAQNIYGHPQPTQFAPQQQPYAFVRRRLPLSFESRFSLYAGAWTQTPWGHFLALGTFNEAASNCVHVVRGDWGAETDSGPLASMTPVADAMVSVPQTKVAWDPCGPDSTGNLKLLSTGDCLRLWNLRPEEGLLQALCPLAKKSKTSHGPAAPLTSFDWSAADNNLAITSSIDTTCTLWDLEAQTVRTQLIAHDSDVYDVAFLPQSPHQFMSAGADGSARLFDLRALDNSTIIFETRPTTPLLRIAPNPTDSNLVACIGYYRSGIYIVDIRAPRNPLSVLDAHQAPVNSIAWAPPHIGRTILASGADDCQVLVWDISMLNGASPPPPLVGCFTDSGQVNNVVWSPDGHYLGSIRGKTLQALKYI